MILSTKSLAIRGVKWTTINKLSTNLIALIKISILTRFLDKTDFGLMALVLFVLSLTTLFVDMGVSVAILHKQNISKNEYATLFWFNVFLSIALYLIIVSITPIISSYYEEDELNSLIPIAGLQLLFGAFGIQFMTIEKKHLRFRFISIIEVISSFFSLVSATLLAIFGFGVYSLIYSILLQAFISNSIFFILSIKKRYIKLYFNLKEAIPFLKIGIYYLGSEVLDYFNRRLDIIFIGKIFGVGILGGYSLAKELVNKPYGIINPILTTVSSPVLAQMQENNKQLKKNYLLLINLIISINLPIYILVIIFANPIVRLIYGAEYLNIVILVRILSCYMIFRAISNPSTSLLIATGKTKIGFYWNLIVLPFIPFAVYLGSSFGIVGVSIFLTIITIIAVIPGMYYFLIKKLCGASFKEYIKSMIPSYVLIMEYGRSYIQSNFKIVSKIKSS